MQFFADQIEVLRIVIVELLSLIFIRDVQSDTRIVAVCDTHVSSRRYVCEHR
jgi:hypothetical protein